MNLMLTVTEQFGLVPSMPVKDGSVTCATDVYATTLRNREWLERQYIQQVRSAGSIARSLGTSTGHVTTWLKKWGIPVRDQADARRLQGASDSRRFAATLYDAGWLRERYEGAGLSCREIAGLVGCSPTSVSAALERLGIVKGNRHVRDDLISESGLRKLAREICPDGLCLFCAADGYVHHKDGNLWNVSVSNLERLCQPHHVIQHFYEAKAALALTGVSKVPGKKWRNAAVCQALKAGFSPSEIFEAGRALMLRNGYATRV